MRRHSTDVTSLVFGIVFLGIAATWALIEFGELTLPAAGVLVPTLLVVAGVVGLVLSILRVRRAPDRAEPYDDLELL